MPEFASSYFGNIAYQPEAVIEFPRGLAGFEDERQFLLIEQAINRPVVFLQSLTKADLCFLTLPVGLILNGYDLRLTEEELAILELEGPPESAADPKVLCLAILSLAEEQPTTANLLSPVVIHWRRRRAVQSVPADSAYSYRHPLTPALREAPCW